MADTLSLDSLLCERGVVGIYREVNVLGPVVTFESVLDKSY